MPSTRNTERRSPVADEKHLHFGCSECRKVFCNGEPDYESLTEGALCPECSTGKLVLLPTVDEDEGGAAFVKQMMHSLSDLLPSKETTYEHARVARILKVATALLPVVTVEIQKG